MYYYEYMVDTQRYCDRIERKVFEQQKKCSKHCSAIHSDCIVVVLCALLLLCGSSIKTVTTVSVGQGLKTEKGTHRRSSVKDYLGAETHR